MSLHAEEDEMYPALQHEPSISISSLFELCVCNFRTLVSTLLSQARPTDVISSFQEEFGRLRIWAGNFGAQREETDNQSLDYALKDAPELYREVIDHFYDLDEVVKEATVISLGEKISFAIETSESESEISDPDTIGQDQDGEDFEFFELEVYLMDIRHTITSLNRFATTLENPAGHQQSMGKTQAQKSAMTYMQSDNLYSATKHQFQPSVQVQPPIKAQHLELPTHRRMQDHPISQSKVPNKQSEDEPVGAFAGEVFRESPGEAFQGRITPGLIQDEYNESGASFVRIYVMEDMIHYHEALGTVRRICNKVLSDHGVDHATEFRLKEPGSLEKKLADLERKRGFPYQTIEDIDEDIFDIAGVCILVHIPSYRTRVSELLCDAFMVKKMVNHPKQDEVNRGQQANRGYVATHLHVLLKSVDVHDRGLQLSDTKPVEIQVTSTGLRAWASLEHDIIYKPKGKPPLGLMLASVDENIYKQMEEVQNNRAAKRKRPLRFIDDVGWGFQKWLEEQPQAWFHDREAGSCTLLFNFLQSRNMDTRGGLRQVLEASFGSDSEAVYSRLASEYPTGSLTLVIFIMDRLLLTGGSGSGSGSVDYIPEDHQVHVYKLQTMMSTFVWLDRLFTPALTWQKVFAVQNQESLRDGLVLLHSTRYDFFLEGNPLGLDDIAIVDRLWNWFEGQHDRQIRLTFAISKNKMFKKRKDALKVIGPLMHGLRH